MTRSLGMLLPLGLLFAGPAFANDGYPSDYPYGRLGGYNQIHGMRVDLHGNVDRWGVFGVGGRLEFALVPNGFLRGTVHDEFALSLGADFLVSPAYFGWGGFNGGGYAVPIAAVQWNLYLGDRWSIFPEAGLAMHMGFDEAGWNDGNGHHYGWLYAEPALGLGARFHFSPRAALLMRLSTPGGLQVGLNF